MCCHPLSKSQVQFLEDMLGFQWIVQILDDEAASTSLVGEEGKAAFAAQNYINLSKTIFMHSTCTGCLKWRKLGSFQLDARLNGATLSWNQKRFHLCQLQNYLFLFTEMESLTCQFSGSSTIALKIEWSTHKVELKFEIVKLIANIWSRS